MTRVLVTVSPLMYREAIALAIHRNRPDLDVRLAPPDVAERELRSFRPHLLVHNDTAPIPASALGGIPCRVEVAYSDSMGARTIVDGVGAEEDDDMDTAGLLGAVDRAEALAEALAGRKPARG